ncbi:hypothetical protein M433DRAFT_160779 [Acidomyces richmondensis BFW]|nr:hypothetical protein M433DRAFT_160779 [Acidomyces richmondensis BFW]
MDNTGREKTVREKTVRERTARSRVSKMKGNSVARRTLRPRNPNTGKVESRVPSPETETANSRGRVSKTKPSPETANSRARKSRTDSHGSPTGIHHSISNPVPETTDEGTKPADAQPSTAQSDSNHHETAEIEAQLPNFQFQFGDGTIQPPFDWKSILYLSQLEIPMGQGLQQDEGCILSVHKWPEIPQTGSIKKYLDEFQKLIAEIIEHFVYHEVCRQGHVDTLHLYALHRGDPSRMLSGYAQEVTKLIIVIQNLWESLTAHHKWVVNFGSLARNSEGMRGRGLLGKRKR